MYFNVLGQHFLILNSPQRITDLFEKRSSNYSDRMLSPVLELYVLDPFYLNKNSFITEWSLVSSRP